MLLWHFLFLNFYLLILVTYSLKSDNELCTSTEIIDTLGECKAAINSLNLTFRGIESSESFPKGCYAYGVLAKSATDRGPYSYWNTHISGGNQSFAHPICKKGESI